MAGYTLILAILVLGSIIATLGDRIGTKVGKARLSIFNLRPRNTATLVTILTGGLISASTLGILLATSSQLRDGLFRLESIRTDLEKTQVEKQKTEVELVAARQQREESKRSLDQINRSLSEALVRQQETQLQLKSVEGKFQKAENELEQVLKQEQSLRQRIQELTFEQENLLAEGEKLKLEREKVAEERDRIAQERDQLTDDLQKITSDRETLRQRVAESQNRLDDLDQQRQDLAKDVEALAASRDQLVSSIQALRRGNVAILSEQVLAAGVMRPDLTKPEAKQAVYALLQQADTNARYLLDFLPGQQPRDFVIRVTDAQVDNLVNRISDGRSYVIRILSAGNYIRQETSVGVSADVTPNLKIFEKGQVIATLGFEPNLSSRELESRVGQLFLLVSFRAKRDGVLADPITGKVGNFSPTTLSELLETISSYKSPFEIRAVAKESIYTSSVLTLELVVLENGVEVKRFS